MNRDTTVGQIERILATNRRARRYRDIKKKMPLNYAVELGPDANEAVIELLLMHYLEGPKICVTSLDERYYTKLFS